MNHFDNPHASYSVFDRNFGRQAMNLIPGSLSDAVRPWFQEYLDGGVEEALANLDTTGIKQRRALEYLGLELLAS